VVVTNPPYSADHIPRLFQWLTHTHTRTHSRPVTPWLVLVPNYVYMKDFFQPILGVHRKVGVGGGGVGGGGGRGVGLGVYVAIAGSFSW